MLATASQQRPPPKGDCPNGSTPKISISLPMPVTTPQGSGNASRLKSHTQPSASKRPWWSWISAALDQVITTITWVHIHYDKDLSLSNPNDPVLWVVVILIALRTFTERKAMLLSEQSWIIGSWIRPNRVTSAIRVSWWKRIQVAPIVISLIVMHGRLWNHPNMEPSDPVFWWVFFGAVCQHVCPYNDISA